MTITDQINQLPTTIADGHTGHLHNHQVIHEGLQDHEVRIEKALLAAENAAAGVAAPVDDPVANVALIQTEIDRVAAGGGGTVVLSHGAIYRVSGTIHLRKNITLDLNRATIFAVPNANFETIDLGTRQLPSGEVISYNPASVKPIISVHGENNAQRLTGVAIRNGTIDGNGTNQPDDGSYANVMVMDADNTVVEDVTSLRARPGLTINTGADGESGPNTGRRAFCLLVGRAVGTVISRGYYSDAGYDVIGLRTGADSTQLIGVHATKAWKGCIQAGTYTTRTKIIGGIWDNRTGESRSSHAIYGHTTSDFMVTGATMKASSGSCAAFFGTVNDGYSEDITITGCSLEQSGGVPAVNLYNGWVRRAAVDTTNITKSGGSQIINVGGGNISDVTLRSVRGDSSGPASIIYIGASKNVALESCNFVSASTANPMVGIADAEGVTISAGSYTQAGGPSIDINRSSDVTISGATLVAADSVRAVADSSNVDVLDNDLSGITNSNKLRIYATSGRVRGNRGAPTEGSGSTTIPSGSTSVTVPHGLWAGTNSTAQDRVDRVWQPEDFQASFAGPPAGGSAVWVSAVTPTSVTLTMDTAPTADVPVTWSARMDRTS